MSVTELEQNWEAVDGSQSETEKKHFFVNICHRVLQTGQARGCPEDAAVCAVGEWYPAVSLAPRAGGAGPEAGGAGLHAAWRE